MNCLKNRFSIYPYFNSWCFDTVVLLNYNKNVKRNAWSKISGKLLYETKNWSFIYGTFTILIIHLSLKKFREKMYQSALVVSFKCCKNAVKSNVMIKVQTAFSHEMAYNEIIRNDIKGQGHNLGQISFFYF